MPTPRQEQLTINAKAGTKKFLAKIQKELGLSKEDVFALGLRYVVVKVEHDRKKANSLGTKVKNILGLNGRKPTEKEGD